jgi:hypothetical protein
MGAREMTEFKVGDKVRLIQRYRDDPTGNWGTCWDEEAGLELGGIYTVKFASGSAGIVLEEDEKQLTIYAPYFVKIEEGEIYHGRCRV